MNPQELLSSFVQQLDALREVLETSPYLPRDERVVVEEEITALSSQFKDGALTASDVENRLKEIENKVALDEIRNLMTKIGGLNPSSPRIANLRTLGERLTSGALTAEQARHALYDLMHNRT